MDRLLESSPRFLPFSKDQLTDVMGIPVGKPGQRKLGCMLRTLSGETFACCRHQQLGVRCETGSGAWLQSSRARASGDGCLPRVSRTEAVIEIPRPETAEGFDNA